MYMKHCHNLPGFVVFQMLRDMRKQFTELLRDMKFVSSDAPAAPDVNKFSSMKVQTNPGVCHCN